MKLRELRTLLATVESNFDLLAVAAQAGVSSLTISRRIETLESELGSEIFTRNGSVPVSLTQTGQRVLQYASRIFSEEQTIAEIAAVERKRSAGSLSIAATPTHARYILPPLVRNFRRRNPAIEVHLKEANERQIARMLEDHRIDVALVSRRHRASREYALFPAYELALRVLVPSGHTLTRLRRPCLERISEHPICTCASARRAIDRALQAAGFRPKSLSSAIDTDAVKAYVRRGRGVGILASVALDPELDADLIAMDGDQWLPREATWVGVVRSGNRPPCAYEFLNLLAPHLTREAVQTAAGASPRDIDAMFARIDVPIH